MWHIQLVFNWCFLVIQQLIREEMIRDRKAEEDAKIVKPWRLWPVLELKMVMSQENTSQGIVYSKLICSRCIQGSNFFSQYFHTPARVKYLPFTICCELFSSVGQTIIWRNSLSSERCSEQYSSDFIQSPALFSISHPVTRKLQKVVDI